MPYIGNTPAEKYASYDVQHITTSATTSYVLDKNVANENEIRVVLNNIIQQPGASYAYTASANTLTLSVATTSNDTLYVVFTGKAVQTVTPPPSSVGLAQLNATGSPGNNTFLRGDNSWATPSDSVSYLVKISSDDTTPDFLNGKLVAGTGISLTEGSGGGDETLTIANTSTGTISAFTNGADNRVVTATSATALNGETNFTYDGTDLVLTSGSANSNALTVKNTADATTGIEIQKSDYAIQLLVDHDNAGAKNFAIRRESVDGSTSRLNYMVFEEAGAVLIKQGIYGISDPNTGIQFDGSDVITVHTAGTERLLINSAGRFGFGTSSIAHPFHFLYDQGGDAVMAVENSNNSNPQGIDLQFTAANPNNTSQYAIHFGATAGTKFIVYSNGNVVNANNSYGSTSDNRLKENITDANSQWNDVKKLKFKNFNLINDSTSQLGVIAQDLENDGMSGLVDESPATKQAIAINSVFGTLYEDGDELPEGKNIGDVKTNLEDVKSVKYSVLLLKSVKALQEAMEKIETLEAKVTALENA